MTRSLAAAITKAASKQTYYTVRFLVDHGRVDDAYRAYAYFRWVDDVLDGDGSRLERRTFLERQKRLLDACLGGAVPRDVNPHETMLVDLLRRVDGSNASGLEAYLRNMMRVMEFDVKRRGKLISQAELNDYTRWLAVAVTEAMDCFIGNGRSTPRDGTRYVAASAAHIMHMLRDTYDDLAIGYYNIPREVLAAHGIEPDDVQSDAYRAWVQSRVQLSRAYFDAGKAYLARVPNQRYRLAGFAYMARFEWLIETLRRDEFRLRPEYAEKRSPLTGLRMGWLALSETMHSYEDSIGFGDWRGHRWHLRGDAPR